jgi:hypothetical protein
MIRRWLLGLAALLLAVTLGGGTVSAQKIEIERGVRGLPQGEDDGSKTAALPYTVAAFSAIMVLVLVCMPTRKS